MLGEAIDSNELDHQRLGIPTALAVFSSDCISSSAYATEEILHMLIPAIGVMAFSLVVPVTIAMLVVLTFLILSYRETIKEYPTAGGAYMVTRDNFGYKPALVAGVSLLTDYILTVAVSSSAGIAALTSLVPALAGYHLPLAIATVVLISYINLRGVKESGKIFMVPTYLFIAAMFILIAWGVAKSTMFGGLHHIPLQEGAELNPLKHPFGKHGVSDAFLYGAGVWVILKAFASAGTAVTGVEAISNGVSAFHKPEWRNARKTLVLMGVVLGSCFLGLSLLATKVHPSPYEDGTPTVISQVGKAVFGTGAVGHSLYTFLQLSTLLVLVLAANTSFADFPRLANFAAGDSYMPRQLMKRGHRLVFSNGIVLLAGCAIALMIVTDANVSRLIPFYAVGVFTSFTMSQAGMTKHHLRKRELGWRMGVFVNGTGAVLSLVVDLIFMATKFTQGAWFIMVLVPVLVVLLVRMNRQYVAEGEELQAEVAELAGQPALRRHQVFVMVDKLDQATARALRYGRSLAPDEIRAVHAAIDRQHADELAEEWSRAGLGRIDLEILDCPDRRITRALLELVGTVAATGNTQVTVLIPRLEYRRAWHRLLHDRTGTRIAEQLGDLPRVNVTFVPFHLNAGRHHDRPGAVDILGPDVATGTTPLPRSTTPPGAAPAGEPERATLGVSTATAQPDELQAASAPGGIGALRQRQRVAITARVASVRVQPWSGIAALEVTLRDQTGSIQVVFLGRRRVAGIEPGSMLHVEGMVGDHRGRLAILNPSYRIVLST